MDFVVLAAGNDGRKLLAALFAEVHFSTTFTSWPLHAGGYLPTTFL